MIRDQAGLPQNGPDDTGTELTGVDWNRDLEVPSFHPQVASSLANFVEPESLQGSYEALAGQGGKFRQPRAPGNLL